MIRKKDCERLYSSASSRFLRNILIGFFRKEFPKIFGPVMRNKIADELMSIFENFSPEVKHLKTGQVFWVAIDKNTRPDSPNRKYKPVVLSLITPEDIEELSKGIPASVIIRKRIARMYKETYDQGAVLSNRDLSLLLLKHPGELTKLRQRYEKENDCILPHSGVIFDMGSTLTHKESIVRKVVIEKKDPSVAARETNHSQKAADRYLKDYYRVRTLFTQNQNLDFIHHVTGIAKYVVKEYINIIKNETSSANI